MTSTINTDIRQFDGLMHKRRDSMANALESFLHWVINIPIRKDNIGVQGTEISRNIFTLTIHPDITLYEIKSGIFSTGSKRIWWKINLGNFNYSSTHYLYVCLKWQNIQRSFFKLTHVGIALPSLKMAPQLLRTRERYQYAPVLPMRTLIWIWMCYMRIDKML